MTTASKASAAPPVDKASLSNPQEILVTHLNWNGEIDFENCVLDAEATYDLKYLSLSSSKSCLCLDTNHLNIKSVLADGIATDFELESPHPHLGQRLRISLGSNEQQTKQVTINYNTTKESSALQWLPPSQTAGKKYPYLFTQCQAIHARSLFPCQDQPGVKFTYRSKIVVPEWATCVMSALHQNDSISNDKQTKTCEWDQPIPIPSYLLALAVGELKSMDISDRVRVWSEPSIVEAVAYEFAETEQFLSLGEEISGHKYPWKRYDLLCLPPSFPYGGMENPCLTFVTPTLLAGDRSLADVVAHEIAHSWTGNLITNATWEHFWLNEGWTTWLQRKMTTKFVGNDQYFDFDSIGGWEDLKESVELMPDKYTRLCPLLGEEDPDDAFSSIPYEKGFNLLYALQKRVGVYEFEQFFQSYIKEFQYKTVTSTQFKDFFISQFPEVGKSIDWESWFHKPGMPIEEPHFDRTLSEASENLAKEWLAFDDEKKDSQTPGTEIKSWSSPQIICFLDALLSSTKDRERPLTTKTLSAMTEQYGMSKSKNSEIIFRFCMLSVASNDESILPIAIRFITTQGRMKFVRPLYRSLYQSTMGGSIAVETFLKHKDFYHPICTKMIANDLKQRGKEEEETDQNKKETKGGDSEISQNVTNVAFVVAIVGVAVGLILLRRKK